MAVTEETHKLESTTLHGRVVLLAEPYRARGTKLVGRETEQKRIQAAWMRADGQPWLVPLLVGPPGVGKTHLASECTQSCGRNLYIVQGTEESTAEDLACGICPSDHPDRKLDYFLSGLATAMLRGDVCLIDEIGLMRQRALALLASVADDRHYIDLPSLGERVYAHPGFRLIATMNPTAFTSQALPEFIKSRLRPVIEVGYPSREEIETNIRGRFSRLARNSDSLFNCFWRLWRQQRKDRMPEMRDVIQIFSFAINLADQEAGEKTNGHDPLSPPPGVLRSRHLEASFRLWVPK